MSQELQDLYKKANIDLDKMKEESSIPKEEVRYVLIKKQNLTSFEYAIEIINIANIDEDQILMGLLTHTMFEEQSTALQHLKYLDQIDRVVAAAAKVNIADNNYKPNFDDEDARKYVINYNQRTKSVSYDFAYTIMVGFTDYRLAFRTQTIAENFISAFQNELKFINQYRVDLLKK